VYGAERSELKLQTCYNVASIEHLQAYISYNAAGAAAAAPKHLSVMLLG